MSRLLYIAAGICVGLAFLYPAQDLGVLLLLLGVVLLSVGVKTGQFLVQGPYIFGIVLSLIGFYWIPDTIHTFGGFTLPLAYSLFALFCAAQSLQFLFVGLVTKLAIRRGCGCFSFPLSWLLFDLFFPQLFPWRLIHPMLRVTPVSALAEVFGVTLLSCLFLMVVTFLVALRGGRRMTSVGAAVALLLLGGALDLAAKRAVGEELKIGLIQGNLSTSEKRDATLLEANVDTYRRLSAEASGAELVIWPETVVNSWMPETLEVLRGTELDPAPLELRPILYGTLSFRKRSDEDFEKRVRSLGLLPGDYEAARHRFQYFNSAVGLDPGGRVTGRYHKRVLMPFGEYLPLEESFPWLRNISPMTGDFTRGDIVEPIAIPIAGRDLTVKAAPLICYEDLVATPSRDGVRRGANLLVNLTNDAWYGKSHAPYQHHLLAAWRAVEFRRYLVRSTNTGFSAIVDHRGETYAGLPWFSEAQVVTSVKLLNGETIYSKVGEAPSFVLVGGFLLGIILKFPRRAR